MDPQQQSRSKTDCTTVISSNTYKHTQKHHGTKKRARCVTAVTREEGRGARWPGDQVTCEMLYSGENMRTPCSFFFRSRNFERPDHAPRNTHGRGPTSRLVYTRHPIVPRSRERAKRPAAGKEKITNVQKNCIS